MRFRLKWLETENTDFHLNWNWNPLTSRNLFQSIECSAYTVNISQPSNISYERTSTNCLGRLRQLCKLLTIYLIILQGFQCTRNTQRSNHSALRINVGVINFADRRPFSDSLPPVETVHSSSCMCVCVYFLEPLEWNFWWPGIICTQQHKPSPWHRQQRFYLDWNITTTSTALSACIFCVKWVKLHSNTSFTCYIQLRLY